MNGPSLRNAVLAATFVLASHMTSAFAPSCQSLALHLARVPKGISLASQAGSIGLDDLRPGDIVSWSTGDGSIEELVAVLSGDPYSHSSIIHHDTTENVEQVTSGASISAFAHRAGRSMCVSRIEGIEDSVLDAAQKYVDAKVPYSWNQLAILAGLLIIKNPKVLLIQTKEIFDAVKIVLKSGSGDGQGETPDSMFCSQFVYQCYDEAGYELKIRDPTFDRALITSGTEETLLDDVIREVSTNGLAEEYRPLTSSSPIDIEEASKTLCDALKERPGVQTEVLQTEELDRELKLAIIDFAILLADKTELDKASTFEQRASMALDSLRKKNFVTPGELTRIANAEAIFVGEFELH